MSETDEKGDVELVQRAQAGNGDALGALVERHRGLVISKVGSMGLRGVQLEDAVGRVVVKVVRKIADLEDPACFAAWLAAAARNTAIDEIRRAKRAPVAVDPTDLDRAPERSETPSGRALFEMRDELDWIRRRIQGLRRKVLRAVGELVMKGLSNAEIAAQLGLSEAAVGRLKSELRRALGVPPAKGIGRPRRAPVGV